MKGLKRRLNLLTVLCLILVLFAPVTVEAASKVKINKTEMTLYIGSTETLKVTGTSKKITWNSNNTKVATVNSKGKVTPKKEGTATITAKVLGKKLSCKVTVKKPSINTSKKTIYVGNTYTLKLKGTDIKSVKSSDNNVATISKTGKVTAKKAGKATITLNGKDGKKYTCKITVKKPYLNETSLELMEGNTFTLKLTGATVKSMVSSNDSVVRVTENGKVIARKEGKATITVKDTKNRIYKCKVVVSPVIHEIYTARDLLKMNDYPQQNFVLKNDIDLSKVNWTPISSFVGKLDGNGYTISNVSIRLFETLEKDSEVCNLTISANIETAENDAILSRNANGIISNCVTKGKISTAKTQSAPMSIGGMVALNNGVIKNCINKAVITQSYAGDRWTSVAGIAGLNFGKIYNCKNEGTITSKSRCTGGIVGNGYYIAHKRQNGVVINCKNTAKIVCTYEGNDVGAVGGIAGANKSLIYNCSNTGKLTRKGNMEATVYMGGICGEAEEYAYIIACKNTASVKFGICGRALLNSCYFNEDDEAVYEGRIMIVDCVNQIDNLSESELETYTICGLAEAFENTITITRCKNVLNGQKTDAYVYEIYKYNGGVVECENNGKPLKNTISSGTSYEIKVEDALDLNENGNDKYETLIMDRLEVIGTNEEGDFSASEKGTVILYAITKDGKIVMHKVTIK